MNGYQGKILIADLTTGTLTDEPLKENYAHDFLGSTGLAARYLFDLVDEKTDPLGPENPLILMTGLLNGTIGPSVSRWGGATKSPYTGHYGDANAGAWFGAELRKAGYDGIILKGHSAKPIYLYIKDGMARLKDAAPLWGLDTAKTQEEIKKSCGDKRTQVACIGPASENLVFTAISCPNTVTVWAGPDWVVLWVPSRSRLLYGCTGNDEAADAGPGKISSVRY